MKCPNFEDFRTPVFCSQDGLVRAKAQANDESYYMWAMRFFMEFNRNYKFQVKLVRYVLLYVFPLS